MDTDAIAPSLAANYYRRYAARVRDLAAETTTPAIREHLHDVARQYDVLADKAAEAERVGRSRHSCGRCDIEGLSGGGLPLGILDPPGRLHIL